MITLLGIFTQLMLVVSVSFTTAAPMQMHYSQMHSGAVALHASQPSTTSVRSQTATAAADTTLVNRLNDLAEAYAVQNDAVKDTAFLYADRAYALAKKIGFKRGMAQALAVTAYRLNLGGEIEQGLEIGFKQLHLAEEIGDERLIARGLINIGFAAGQQSKTDAASIVEAREHLLKALGIANALHDDFLIAFSCNALGRLARLEERLQVARVYHQRALGIAERIRNVEQSSWALHSLGVIYELQKRYDIALAYAERSLALREQSGRAFAVATSLRLVGLIHFRQGRYSESKRFAERSIAVGKDLDGLFLVKMQATQLLSDAYLALNKPTEALQWYKISIATKDSAATIEAKNNILHLQAQIDAERTEREQALLLRDNQLQDILIQRQYAIGIVILGCLALLSLAIAMLWQTNQLKKKQNEELTSAYKEIQKQQEVLEEQAREIEISNTQLQETNETLAASNTALGEANTFKLNMLSIAAHDLKNPLHTITNFADLLKEEPDSRGINVQEFAERISRICERMLALIHDLLETAAHDLGKIDLQIQPVNLSDLAIAVAEQYQGQANVKDQQILLEHYCECWVEGDVQRLYQVVENLLSNAIKYSPWSKRIWMNLSLHPEQGIVQLSVKDEGPGMTPEDQDKAFVMFQRLSAQVTGGESSTGVGLALVKQIVELHGGQVRIASEEGSGTEFIAEFPLYATPSDKM